jgi:hypothetical protein
MWGRTLSIGIAGRDTHPKAVLNWRSAVFALVCVGAFVVAAERLWFAAKLPFWLDETWTAAIVSAPDWRSFWREVYLDVNAPLYYLFMRPWSAVFGLSDFALRLPGLIGVAAAAVIAARCRIKGLSSEARLTWGALLFFWWGVGTFLDARCYGLLLAISTWQCVAFGRLMETPSTGKASLWVAVCTLAILTQYYAVFICAAQGLIYLGVHRGRAVRSWPALLLLAPALAWAAVHAPRLIQYAQPEVAWHDRVDAPLALAFSSFTIGALSPALSAAAVLVVIAAGLAPRWLGREAPDSERANSTYAWAIAGAGALALALALLSGVLRPSLTARYLIPIAPSMLLGLVLCARATAGARLAYGALAILYLGFAADPTALIDKLKAGAPYGTEQPSAFLTGAGVTDVVFIWDHPAVRIMDPESLRRVGSVFFRRQARPVRVTPLIVTEGQDPNRLALSAATGARPGVIWIFDRTGRTAARTAPPRLAELDPAWTCRTFGDGMIGSVACYRRP